MRWLTLVRWDRKAEKRFRQGREELEPMRYEEIEVEEGKWNCRLPKSQLQLPAALNIGL